MYRLNRSPTTLQPLAPAVDHMLHQAGLGHLVLLGRLMRQWPAIVGPQLAMVARPERLRARVLFVTVIDAIWLQQITFFHSQLLQNIHKVLGDVPIAKVHFTLATTVPPVEAPAPAQRITYDPLTPEEEQQVCEGTASIVDPELREIIQRAWRQGWQARK